MAKKTPKPQTAGKPGPAPRRPASKLTLALLAMLCLGVMVQLSALNRQIDAAQEEREAYRSFGRVLARVVNLDDEAAISQAECQAFGDVLELSGVTYR